MTEEVPNQTGFHCLLGQKSLRECGPKSCSELPLQTLSELEASNCRPGSNKNVKISWIILSRLGVNFLVNPSTYSHLTICPNHRREFLDNWRMGSHCRYPNHADVVRHCPEAPLTESDTISLVMAVKILQKMRQVVAISGRICKACKDFFERTYPTKPGEKMVIVLSSRGQGRPPISAASPFGPPLDSTEALSQSRLGALDASLPNITLKTEVLESAEDPVLYDHLLRNDLNDEEFEDLVEIKDELTDSPAEAEPSSKTYDESVEIVPVESGAMSVEEDEDSIFSEDSDDDRTWMPDETRPKRAPPPPSRPPRAVAKKRKLFPDKKKGGKTGQDSEAMVTGGGGVDVHYFCKICKITFYKHTSYKKHMESSQKTHKEIADKARVEEEFECSDCCIAFQDLESQSRHMAQEHGGGKHPFYCTICNVQLKSESAFKSHNSKLHLERSNRMFYCRECDATFACKVKHQTHIKSHRLWSGEDPGLQCQICGKVFASKQLIPFQRHSETHDAEPSKGCPCPLCAAENSPAKVPAGAKGSKSAEKAAKTKGSRSLTHKQGKFGPSNPVDDEEENVDDPAASADGTQSLEKEMDHLKGELAFQCGLCRSGYESLQELDKHVQISHQNTRNKSGATAEPSNAKLNKSKMMTILSKKSDGSQNDTHTPQILKPSEKHWQESADRNWAAEFGYGKTKVLAPNQSNGLLSAMKSMFKHDEEEETAEEPGGDGFQIYRSRGLNGRSKASLLKIPRTLSASSLSTRKRLEFLMKKAQKMHEEREKKKKKVAEQTASPAKENVVTKEKPTKTKKPTPKVARKNPRTTRGKAATLVTSPQAVVETREIKPTQRSRQVPPKEMSPLLDDDDEDEDFIGFEDEDESILIPLVNGWVCEKQPSDQGFLTSFWSPEGGHFTSLNLIEDYLKKTHSELRIAVFKKAVDKVPKHTSTQLNEIMSDVDLDDEDDDDDTYEPESCQVEDEISFKS